MLLHPSLFQGSATSEWSGQRMEFHFHLTRLAAWDGLSSATQSEIAFEMNCSSDAVRRYIVQAKDDGILREDASGKLWLTTYVTVADEGKAQEHYVRHFPFFYTEEFRSLSVQAKRFLLHCLANGAYWKARGYERKLKDLYHGYLRAGKGKIVDEKKRGLFNVYHRQQMLDVFTELSPYLEIRVRPGGKQGEVVSVRVRPDYFPDDDAAISNVGKHRWVQNKLDKYGYILSSIQPEAVNGLVAIMDDYVDLLAYDDAAELFEESLAHLQLSLNFTDKLTREECAQEVYAMFYAEMKRREEAYVEQLAWQYHMLDDEEGAKASVLDIGFDTMAPKISELRGKLSAVRTHWKRRFTTPGDPFFKLLNQGTKAIESKKKLLGHFPALQHWCEEQARNIEEARDMIGTYNWLEEEA